MRNVKITVKDHTLTAVVDLSKDQGPSKSGKTILVASTGGNADIDGHAGFRIGVNVYKAKAAE